MQFHLAGIHIGEKILANQPGETKGSDRNGHEGREDPAAMPQRPIQQADVAEAQALEQPVE